MKLAMQSMSRNCGFGMEARMYVDETIAEGFQLAHANRTFNVYGVGHYFAKMPLTLRCRANGDARSPGMRPMRE